MTAAVTPARACGAPAVVDGVDLDVVAAAVRRCAAVDDLCTGLPPGVVSYLPGRRVTGVQVGRDHVVVSVRAQWGVAAAEVARQVRIALATLTGSRRVDVVIADLAGAAEDTRCLPLRPGRPGHEVSQWTTSSGAGQPGVPISGPVTPTMAAIPPRSAPD